MLQRAAAGASMIDCGCPIRIVREEPSKLFLYAWISFMYAKTSIYVGKAQ